MSASPTSPPAGALPRLDGHAKVTGEARYVDDIHLPGLLHGRTIRSTIPRGRITGIHFDPAFDWSAFTIVTAADIPGANEVLLITTDQPFLVDREVRHQAEPILLLAHADPQQLLRAERAIRIEYEASPPCLDARHSLRPEFLQYGTDNTFHRIDITKGDVEAGFEAADLILDEGYETGAQEQAYIETQGMVAVPGPAWRAPDAPEFAAVARAAGLELREDPQMKLALFGSLQCPYYVVKAVTHLLGIPAEELRVIQTVTGGGFGGKEEYPSMIAGHAALLARKSGRPVKLVYDRYEDILATTKRHPSFTNVKAGVTRDGRLTALEIDVVMDGGAYATLSAVVLSRGALHASGPYACPNIVIRARSRLTNTPPHGAFRGFGAPQTIFAIERHMDRLARTLGLDPLDFRARNYLKTGDRMATGQLVRDDVDMPGLAAAVDAALGGAARREEIARFNATEPHRRRGIGFSAFYHGAGFTGSGEERLASVVGTRFAPDGTVEILSSNTEIGQGTVTIFSQIAARALGLDPREIRVITPDTGQVPDSGPTVASRTAMIVGYLVEQAAVDLARQLATVLGMPHDTLLRGETFRRASADARVRDLRITGRSQYRKPEFVEWDEKNYRGDAYATYAWAVYGAEVEVDTRSGEARVVNFVANQEIGHVLHPVLATGQIQGGVVQGIGWALCEEVVYKNGGVQNAALSTYVIPTFVDVPPVTVLFEGKPFAYGPSGAKGIGELPMDGPAPAIANALSAALEFEVTAVPCRPERLLAGIVEREAARG